MPSPPPGVDFSPGMPPQGPQNVTVSQYELNNLRHRLEERAKQIDAHYSARTAAYQQLLNEQVRQKKAELYRHYADLAKREAQLQEREEAVRKAAERLKTEAQLVNEFKRRNVTPEPTKRPIQGFGIDDPRYSAYFDSFASPTRKVSQNTQRKSEPTPFSREWYQQRGYQYQGNGPQQRTREIKVGRQGRDSRGRFTKIRLRNSVRPPGCSIAIHLMRSWLESIYWNK